MNLSFIMRLYEDISKISLKYIVGQGFSLAKCIRDYLATFSNLRVYPRVIIYLRFVNNGLFQRI